MRACLRAHTDPRECIQACNTCEEMLLYCGQVPEAQAEHKQRCANDYLFAVMVEVYRCYPRLQQSFKKPLIPDQMRHLLNLYNIADIWRLMEAIDNKREQVKGNSLFQTIKQWATTDIVLANKRREQLN